MYKTSLPMAINTLEFFLVRLLPNALFLSFHTLLKKKRVHLMPGAKSIDMWLEIIHKQKKMMLLLVGVYLPGPSNY